MVSQELFSNSLIFLFLVPVRVNETTLLVSLSQSWFQIGPNHSSQDSRISAVAGNIDSYRIKSIQPSPPNGWNSSSVRVNEIIDVFSLTPAETYILEIEGSTYCGNFNSTALSTVEICTGEHSLIFIINFFSKILETMRKNATTSC